MGFVAAFALIMIVVSPEDFPVEHQVWSAIFFATFGFAAALSATTLWSHRDFIKPIAYYTFVMAAFDIAFGVALSNVQRIQWIVEPMFLGYVLLMAHNFRKIKIAEQNKLGENEL